MPKIAFASFASIFALNPPLTHASAPPLPACLASAFIYARPPSPTAIAPSPSSAAVAMLPRV